MTLHIRYSQNYLRSPALVKFLLNQTSIRPEDTVIDIGAGYGIITQALQQLGTDVIAIEKDSISVKTLRERYKNQTKVKIEEADFLKYALPVKKFKVFANIPFGHTTEILKKIIHEEWCEEAYLILQKEAFEKFSGQPHSAETLTSLQLKPFFEFKILHTLKPEDFVPVPKVTSVLISIKRRIIPLVEVKDSKLYKEFVTYGFIQHKPNLVSSYKKIFEQRQFSKLMSSISFSKETKLTGLNFIQWLGVFEFFNEESSEFTKQKVLGSMKKLESIQAGVDKVHRTRRN